MSIRTQITSVSTSISKISTKNELCVLLTLFNVITLCCVCVCVRARARARVCVPGTGEASG